MSPLTLRHSQVATPVLPEMNEQGFQLLLGLCVLALAPLAGRQQGRELPSLGGGLPPPQVGLGPSAAGGEEME